MSAAKIKPFKLDNTRKQLSTANIISKESNQVLAPQTNDIQPVAPKRDDCNSIAGDSRLNLYVYTGGTVSFYPHSNAKVPLSIKKQVDNINFAHTSFFASQPTEEITDFLIERGPNGLEYVYLLSDGSEAMESVLELARQYFIRLDENYRKYFIVREQNYHGNTLGTLAVGRICVENNGSTQFLLKQNN